ncbi:hypothetical protein FHS83_001027 [Rhizomicrobium palustre]|uniref:Peptidase S1 domain-containing protein n=1 Tax=Rhizomicrobium palustre TaxID=189966 RepID=A0A846MWU3_9PROT|nr:hypothetical protein [Rhizomicrobium palustre]NIK87709.1 hypothetical protein [Rhizomicrobium palustre]
MAGVSIVDVGVLVSETQAFISSAGYTYCNSPKLADSDYTDLSAFEFTRQADNSSEIERTFFHFDNAAALSDGDDVILYLAFGCAFADQNYDVAEANCVGRAVRALLCDPNGQISDPAVGRCKLLSEMHVDPNGFSGGPVFAIVFDGHLTLKFAGVINRAGGSFVHFIKAPYVRRLLDFAVSSYAI